jgi:hypothetical protein
LWLATEALQRAPLSRGAAPRLVRREGPIRVDRLAKLIGLDAPTESEKTGYFITPLLRYAQPLEDGLPDRRFDSAEAAFEPSSGQRP